MYTTTALYYDRIYASKDYAAEAAHLLQSIRRETGLAGGSLLDVACGTGRHIQQLKAHFAVQGLDITSELLEIARERNPGVDFHLGDMTDFWLGQRFDVVTCLFSAIGYVVNLEGLDKAIGCMARHVRPGGVLVVEPWLTPDAWKPNTVHAQFIDERQLKLARVSTSFVEGRLSYFDLHHLIGTPEETEYLVERHEMGLFTVDEMLAAFRRAGLDPTYEPEGPTGRGLYLARRTA